MRKTVCFLFLLCMGFIPPLSVNAKTEEEYKEEIQALRERNAQLENKLEEVTADLKRSTATIKVLKKQIAEMTSEVEKNAQEVKDTRAAMKQVKDQLKTLLEQQPESSAKETEKQLAISIQRVQELEKDLKNAKTEIKEQKEIIEDLKKKKPGDDTKELSQELESVQAELQKQQKQFKATVELLQDREEELKEAQATIQELNKQVLSTVPKTSEKTDQRVVELEATLEDVNAKLIKMAQEKSLLEAQLKEFQDRSQEGLKDAEIARLEGELRKAADYINARIAEIASLTTANTDLETRLAEITQAKVELESRLAAMTAAEVDTLKTSEKTEQRVAELEAMLADVNARLVEVTQEKSLLESQLKDQQGRQQDSTKDAEIIRLEGELRKAADYINARVAEIVSLTKANTDLESQLAEVTAAKADLEAQLADNSGNLRGWIQEVELLKSDIAKLQASLNEVERKNLQLTQMIADLEAQLQETGSVPDAAKKRIQELTQELQDTKVQLDTQQRLQTEYPKLQQEAAACLERVEELTKEQEKCQSLQGQFQETQLALEQSKKELDAVTTRNLELKDELQNEMALRQSQEQRFNEIAARNTELEQKYTQGSKELELKEQLLQKVLTEKSLLEKKFDEEGRPIYETLQTQFEQEKARNALLQGQIAELRKAQSQIMETRQDTTSVQTALQQQILQERTLRKQTEDNLIEAHDQMQVLQQQVSELKAQLTSRQDTIPSTQTLSVASGYSGLSGSIRALFPHEISQSMSGGTITILGWSADRTKIAYQESYNQRERLWIFNTQTKQSVRLTEWQSFSSSTPSLSRFAWASDNEHFLFATGYPERYVLHLGNRSGLIGSPLLLKDHNIHFAWSPTRLQFAYFSGSNLIIQDVKGDSLPLQLGHTPGAEGTSLEWSPDGTMIAFSVKRGGSFDIFTLTLSEGQPLLQTLVASSSDDIQPSWSPDGENIAFYVRSEKYDTKIAVTPVNRSRSPYIIAHNTSLPPFGGPQWLTNTELLYVGEEHLSSSQNSIYTVDITTGRRSSAPISVLLAN